MKKTVTLILSIGFGIGLMSPQIHHSATNISQLPSDKVKKEIPKENKSATKKFLDWPGGWPGDWDPNPGFGEDFIQVNLSFDYNPTEYTILSYQIINSKTREESRCQPGLMTTDVKIPAGSYDFIIEFAKYNPQDAQLIDYYSPHVFVIKEQQEVSENNNTFTFEPEESKNLLTFIPKNRDGEEWEVGTVTFIDEPPYYLWNDENANCIDVTFIRSIYHKEFGSLNFYYGNWGHQLGTGEKGKYAADIYLNDVSDNYIFTYHSTAFDKDENGWTSCILTEGIDSNKDISNNYENFSIFNYPRIEHSPAFGTIGEEITKWGYTISSCMNNTVLMKDIYYVSGNNWIPSQYFDTPVTFGTDGSISSRISNQLYELEEALGPDPNDPKLLVGITTPDALYVNSNIYYRCFNDKRFDIQASVFSNSTSDLSFGNNVDLNTFAIYSYKMVFPPNRLEEDCIFHNFFPGYTGMWGEINDMNQLTSNAKVFLNDNLIEELPYYLLAYYGASLSTKVSEREFGQLRFEITNDNFSPDGIPGQNFTSITIDETQGELQGDNYIGLPSFSGIQFKPIMGLPTNKFVTLPSASLTVAVGEWNSEYTGFLPIDFKVEYAEYGSEEFEILGVPSIVNDGDPSTGYFPMYKVNFTGPTMNLGSHNGWFDIRLTATDENGNTNTQILSPAFYMPSKITSGVAEVKEEDIHISSDRQFISILGENIISRVISLSGNIVFQGSNNIPLRELEKGIYIIQIQGENGKTISRKIAI